VFLSVGSEQPRARLARTVGKIGFMSCPAGRGYFLAGSVWRTGPARLGRRLTLSRFWTCGQKAAHLLKAPAVPAWAGNGAAERTLPALVLSKLDNIQTLHGCQCITIEGKTKNRSSNRRVIPVHSTLLALGFEKRVAELKAKGATHFFPGWYADGVKSQRYERFIPRWFNERLKPHLCIADKLKVFHSLRHNFTTALDQAGVPMDIQERLCGHAKRTPHMGYVHSAPITAMKEAVEKLRYDGFTL